LYRSLKENDVRIWRYTVSITVALAVLALWQSGEIKSIAADHFDAPSRTDPAVDPIPDIAADIADVYAWHGDTTLRIALTFAGPAPGTQGGRYDRDVLYTINISNAGSRADPEMVINVRFGQDNGAFGVQASGLPGVTGALVGPVETDLQKDGVKFRAGVFDDPFVFDLQGFRETRSTGALSFRNDRDFFRGQNDTAVVLEIPLDRIRNGTNLIGVWATSSRFGGNI
jgi:hypothetical protein